MFFTNQGRGERFAAAPRKLSKISIENINLNAKKLSHRQLFSLSAARRKLKKFNQSRNDKQSARRSQNRAGQKPRKMSICPNVEKSERPVNSHRNHRQEKPETRKRVGFLDTAHQRINYQPEKQPEINAETPRTNRESVFVQMNRAVGNLMTDEPEKLVNRT